MRGALIGQEMGRVKLSVCVWEGEYFKGTVLHFWQYSLNSDCLTDFRWISNVSLFCPCWGPVLKARVVGLCFVNPDIHFNNKWLQSFTQRWNSRGCCYLSKKSLMFSFFPVKKILQERWMYFSEPSEMERHTQLMRWWLNSHPNFVLIFVSRPEN